MKFLQSILNKIQPPITFETEISEPETRMTLKEMCGSSWDECEFNGDVSQNSFSFMKNNTSHTHTKGIPRVILDGKFYEENGRTHVTICPRIQQKRSLPSSKTIKNNKNPSRFHCEQDGFF